MKRFLIVLGLVGCGGGPVSPGPLVDVTGQWAFTASFHYTDSLTCYDSMTMSLTQRGQRVTGTTNNWVAHCGDSGAFAGPPLTADGTLTGIDTLTLRWLTSPTHPNCSLCQAFLMAGQVLDSVMSGQVIDPLGALGTWSAHR